MGRSRAQSSVGAALDIVADQWTLLIIRDLFAGVSTWKGLSDSLAISPATLKRRLDLLVAAGCVTRNQEAGKKQVRYELTAQGFELFPFLMAAREWQLRWDARPEARVTNWHHSCGEVLRCAPFCRSCGEAVRSDEVVLDDKALPGNDAVIPAQRYRYVSAKPEQGNSNHAAQRPKVVDVLGESRTTAVMAALLRGDPSLRCDSAIHGPAARHSVQPPAPYPVAGSWAYATVSGESGSGAVPAQRGRSRPALAFIAAYAVG